MKALVMAGGQGSRLRPLTCDRPKPMVPVCNEPVMAHILRLLARCGMQEVLVTLHPMPEVVQEYFGAGESHGVHLRYLVEDRPLGTAGGVARARPYLDGTFVVVSGDAFTDIDLAEAVRFHRSRGALATLVLKAVADPGEYGIVITDADGRIRRFLEKPGRGEVFSDHANTGIYVLEPQVLDGIEPGRPVDFSQDLFPALLQAGEPLYGWLAPSGYWSDIGTPEQYRQTHLDVMAAWPAQQAVQVGPGCRIAPTARLNPPCLLGPGCEVEEGAEVGPLACLGEGCHVGRGATVRHSVLWKGCWLGPGVEVRGAVLADGVVLGRAARVFEGAVLGRRCRVGEGAVVGPGVRLWPEKQVEELERLSRSVVWSGTALPAVVGPLGVRGEANVGLTPEVACGVGGAFAGRLAAGSQVVVAHAGGAAARGLAWAAAAGVASAGCHVSWLDAVPAGVARQAVRLGGQGGIYVSAGGDLATPEGSAGEAEVAARLRLWDARGLELGAREARAVDGAFRREEWRRAGAAGMGDLHSAFELHAKARSAYLSALHRWCAQLARAWASAAASIGLPVGCSATLAGPLPAEPGGPSCAALAAPSFMGFARTPPDEPLDHHPAERGAGAGKGAVAVAMRDPQAQSPGEALLVDALRACGLEVVDGAVAGASLSDPGDGAIAAEFGRPQGALGGAGSQPGVGPTAKPVVFVASVSPCGEQLELLDGRGRRVSPSVIEDLACLLAGLAALPGERVPLPLWAGDAVEGTLRRMGREPMRTAAHPAVLAAGREEPWGHPLLDGVVLACGLAVLAARAGGLGPLIRAVSPQPRLRLEVPVGRGRIGQVMRRLAREIDGRGLWAADGQVGRWAGPSADTWAETPRRPGAGQPALPPVRDPALAGFAAPASLAADGLRVCHQRGWAVVRPDPDRPVVELRVEAATLEDARELLARYLELVRGCAQA